MASVTAERAGEVTVGEAVQQRRARDEFVAHTESLEGEVAVLRAAQAQRGEKDFKSVFRTVTLMLLL